MIRAARLLLVAALGCAACRSEGQTASATTASRVSETPAAAPTVPTPDPKEALTKAVTTAASAFTTTRGAAVEQRVGPLGALADAVDAGRGSIDVAVYEQPGWRTAFELTRAWNQLAVEEATASAAAPAALEPPKLEVPEYVGAQQLGGIFRGPYNGGGIVVESNGKYYVIEGASIPDFAAVHGYVDDTGREVTLDIGRDGRTAKVMTVSDKESYRDDKIAHREAVAEAQRNFADAQKEYQRQLAENGGAIADARKAKAERDTRRTALTRSLQATLVALDAGDTAASPAAATPVAPSSPPAGGAPRATPKPAGPSRASCLRTCVGGCGGDPGCERSCATTRCP